MYRIAEGRLRKLTIGKGDRLTPDEARRLAREKLGEVAVGRDPASEKRALRAALTVTELCDKYMADQEANDRIKKSTLSMDRSRIECHVQPLLGRRAVTSLTRSEIEGFQRDIVAGKTAKPRASAGRGGMTRVEGVAARTIGMLGTILEYAKQQGIATDDPVRGISKPRDRKMTRFLSGNELQALGWAIRAAQQQGVNEVALDAIKMLLLTGCRRNEILALPFGWLDVLQQLCADAQLSDVWVNTLRHSFSTLAVEMGYSELTIRNYRTPYLRNHSALCACAGRDFDRGGECYLNRNGRVA